MSFILFFGVEEISHEDQEKIEQFMQTSQKPWQRDRKGQQKQNRAGGQQPVPSLLRGIRPLSAPGLVQRQPSGGGPPFSGFNQRFQKPRADLRLGDRPLAVGDNSFMVPSDSSSKPKILLNPHFRGPAAFGAQMVEAGTGRPSPQQMPSLMSLNVTPRHPHQQFAVCTLLLGLILIVSRDLANMRCVSWSQAVH